jgi:hypothetical protein
MDNERAACDAETRASQAVAGPGTRVALSVSNNTSYSPDVAAGSRRGMQRVGLIADDAAPLRLIVELVEEDAQTLVKVEGLLRVDPSQRIQTRRVVLKRELVDAGGKAIWRGPDIWFSMSHGLPEQGTRDEIVRRLRSNLEERLHGHFERGLALPDVFFADTGKLGVGKSTLPVGP